MQNGWQTLYQECCIFPLVDSPRFLQRALDQPGVQVVVLGDGLNLLNVKRLVAQIHEAERLAFVDLDLVGGLAADQHAVNFLTKEAGADGLISKQRPALVQAKKQGVFTVFKVFAQDLHAIEVALSHIEAGQPDALDLLPGAAAPFALPHLRKATDVPISISGFYELSPAGIASYLRAGVAAIHTRERALWGLSRSRLLAGLD